MVNFVVAALGGRAPFVQVLFSTFLLSFVDWTALLSCRDEDTCHPLSKYVTTRALHSPNLFHVLVW